MKKFYLFIMALVGYATTFAQPLNGDCPSTLRAEYFTVTLSPPFCKLFITGGPTGGTPSAPVASVVMKDPFGATIPTLDGNTINYLEPNGSATLNYNCATIDRIEVSYWVGNVLKDCRYRPAAGGALPIKLSALTGRLSTETEATIDWTSSLEENSFKYEVQRSADGKNFVTVGTVNAAGTSLESIKYSFKDALPGAGGYFYRLNMIDIDGKTELSKVVYVNSKKGSGIITKLFPNPFNSEVQLIGATSADLNTPGAIKVFNMSGQQINFRVVGANAISIDPGAPKGVYLLKFRSKDGLQEQTLKLMKN